MRESGWIRLPRAVAQGRLHVPTGTGALTSGRIAEDISIVPLSIPFISGPGAIASAMILTSEAPGLWYGGGVFIAVLITTASCYFALIHSRHVIRVLGESGRKILTKIFGLILAVIAVQFVINGIADAVGEFIVGLD